MLRSFLLSTAIIFGLFTAHPVWAQHETPASLPTATNIQNDIPAFQDTTQTAPAPQTPQAATPAPNPDEIDPCAAYMNHYDIYTVCQDRMQKVQRMKDAKTNRAGTTKPRLTQQQMMQQKAQEEAALKAQQATQPTPPATPAPAASTPPTTAAPNDTVPHNTTLPGTGTPQNNGAPPATQ